MNRVSPQTCGSAAPWRSRPGLGADVTAVEDAVVRRVLRGGGAQALLTEHESGECREHRDREERRVDADHERDHEDRRDDGGEAGRVVHAAADEALVGVVVAGGGERLIHAVRRHGTTFRRSPGVG